MTKYEKSVAFLIPKCDADVERVLAHPFGLREMLRWLESRGVKGDQPLLELSPDDARNVVRCIMRELRMRENSS